MDEYKMGLLRSLKGGGKRLDMGRSPVSAIGAAFDMMDEGLVTWGEAGLLMLTEAGRALLEADDAA